NTSAALRVMAAVNVASSKARLDVARRNAMTELTRRSLLTGTVATTATAAVPFATNSPARAAAPPGGTQAPGWYRYKVGSFEITVVTDGGNRVKLPDNIVFRPPLQSDRRQYRTEARGRRHRLG